MKLAKMEKNNSIFLLKKLQNYDASNDDVLDNKRTRWRLEIALFVFNNASNRLTRGLKTDLFVLIFSVRKNKHEK